jgi:3-hydroxyisobutyrate dehydrogenase-like beta-hydroxyacid dehydrogenase
MRPWSGGIEDVVSSRRYGSTDREGARMRLGFIGAGRMGRPMVRRLAGAGHEVRVLGRSAGAREELAGEGVPVAADVAGAVGGADAVLVCVFTDEQVREVCLGGDLLAGMPGGSVVVVHTTASPHTIAAIADRAAPYGIEVVDAPVSGGPPDIAAGRLTLFVGGADDTVARVRPVLESYGDPILHVGPVGAGQRVKLVNNAVFTAQIGLLADAVRLGGQLGVDEAVLLGALTHGSAASRALAGIAGAGSVAKFTSAVGDFVGKDVDVVRKVVGDLGGDLGTLNDAINLLRPIQEESRMSERTGRNSRARPLMRPTKESR